MANKQNKRRRKFGMGGGRFAVKRMRPWTRDLWLEKRATQGFYWYCCPRCHKKFSDTTDLKLHQQKCKLATVTKEGREKASGSPLLDRTISTDRSSKKKALGFQGSPEGQERRTVVTGTGEATLVEETEATPIDSFKTAKADTINGGIDILMQSKSQVSSCDLDNNAEAYHGEKRSPSPTTESDTCSGKRLRPNALEEHTNNRKSSKRKTKPTWKLNGYLQTCKKGTSCNMTIQRKTRKYEKHFLSGVKTFSSRDMSSNESAVISTAIPPADINGAIGKEIKDDKGTINKESNSQCVKGKTNIDTEERRTLENTKKQACSQPVYVITTDKSEYTYYLMSRTKEPDKSTTENWETVSYYDRMVSYAKQNRKTDKHGKIANKSRKHRKPDVVPEPGKVSYWKSSKAIKIKKVSDTTPAENKSAQELTKLEDHPGSYCLEEFTELAPSARHKPEEEKQCVRYLCKLCGSYRTLVREQLEQHIGYHKSGKLNCKHCQFVADSTYNLRNHITAEHHETGAIFLCEFCGVEMGSWNTYKNHVSKVHGKSIFQCRQCNSMFHNDTEYRHHRLNAHEFSSAFKCDKCKEIYLSETSYDAHRMNGKCDLTLFKCKYCDLVRDSISRIQYHEKMVHSRDSVHKCTICSFSAVSKTQLTHHTNAHLGIHPYSCDLCNFSCVKKYQLTSHQRTHSGEKMFKCDKCTYAAAWNVQLKSHLKAHDSETQRVCSQCGIVVKDKRCLKLHENKEHKRK